jgi:hypothetical protein
VCLGLQRGDDRIDRACQQWLQVCTDPSHALRMSLPPAGRWPCPRGTLRHG